MPTKQERNIVAKLMLAVVNAYDPNRKDFVGYEEKEMRPEYTLAELRPLAKEAIEEAQAMLASWGGK